MSPSLQIFISLFTVLSSGVVSAVVTYKLNTRRAEREFLRKKLEDCYDSAHRFCTLMGISHMIFIDVLKGVFTWDQANDRRNKENDPEEFNYWPNLEKLVNIYFPELRKNLEDIESCRDALNECKRFAKKSYLEQNPSLAIGSYHDGIHKLDQVEDEFKKAIFVIASRLR